MSFDVTTGTAAPADNLGQNADPAAAQNNAATTQPQTDGGEGGEGESGTPKTFSQKELDDIVRRRVAKAEAKAERRVLRTLEQIMPRQQSQQHQTSQQPQGDGRPTRAQGETDDAYFDRLTDWKLAQRDSQSERARQQQQAQSLAQKTEEIYAKAEKIDGFDRETFDDLPLTKPIVEALIESDAPEKLMHYMASHPEDVERIAKLSPARQAAELGKLEAKALEAKPPQRSNAPPALGSVKGGAGSGNAPDPKNTKAWIDYQNARERAPLLKR
jgi:hypothetical protein